MGEYQYCELRAVDRPSTNRRWAKLPYLRSASATHQGLSS